MPAQFVVTIPSDPSDPLAEGFAESVRALVDARAEVRPAAYISEWRRSTNKQIEARNRALRTVAARIEHARGDLLNHNLGLVAEALRELASDLESDQGPCYLVAKELGP